MKIAYVIYDYVKPGGIEKYVRFLAEKYAGEHEVHVVTAHPQNGNSSIAFHAIDVPSCLPSFVKLVLFAKRAEEELRKERYDIIHSQGADCRTHNVITAHSCHKAWVEKAKSFGLWENLKKVLNPIHAIVLGNERHNYDQLKRGIAVSNEVKKEILMHYEVPGDRIEVIYPGVESRVQSPASANRYREEMRRKHGIADDEYVILFVSNEFRRKGLKFVIEALSLLNDPKVTLLVVGRGNPVPYVLRSQIMGLKSRIIFAGPTGNVDGYYVAADLFLLPTRHEAFGMVITEAMAASVPVIVTRYAGAAELITDPNCLLDDPMDARAIAEKVRFFVSNRKVAEETGAALRKIAERYTWDVMAEKTMRVYRTAAGQ